MGQWTAKCWLGSSSGYQQLTVKSNTWTGAKEQLERIYGAEQIINLEEVRGSNNTNSSSSSYDIPLPSFGTIVKCIGLGTVVMWGLQFVQVPNIDQPAREGTLMERIQQRNETIIQHANHHKDDTIPEFFNTEYQEDVVDGLGQDWDN